MSTSLNSRFLVQCFFFSIVPLRVYIAFIVFFLRVHLLREFNLIKREYIRYPVRPSLHVRLSYGSFQGHTLVSALNENGVVKNKIFVAIFRKRWEIRYHSGCY